MPLPNSLDEAVAQAQAATQSALDAGYSRLQVELLFPELKPMPVAEQFITLFGKQGEHLKVFFADAGAAALARREWGQVPFTIRGVAELVNPIQPEDEVFVFVAPSPVEVREVEAMGEQAGDRPFILLNPKLQDVSIVGIGYAGRQLRERFLNTFETSYYLRPLDGAAVMRAYPGPWEVYLERTAGNYELIAEEAQKPVGEELDKILLRATASEAGNRASRPGLMTNLQRFLRALSQ
jgi:hypothetical protein